MSIVAKFGIWSVILVLLVLWATATASWNNQNSNKHDFTFWQEQYRNIAADIATDPTIKEATLETPTDVNQVTVLGFSFIRTDGTSQQRVDRCESCHAGLENPQMTAENMIRSVDHRTVTAAEVPQYLIDHPAMRQLVFTLGAHPGKTLGFAKGNLPWAVATAANADPSTQSQEDEYTIQMSKHPFATFGCTTCHYGSGRELEQDKAHGDSEFWLQPLLKSKYMDAACAQCHQAYNATALAQQSEFNTQSAKLTEQLTKDTAAAAGPAQITTLKAAYLKNYTTLYSAYQSKLAQTAASSPIGSPVAQNASYVATPATKNDPAQIFSATYLPEMTTIARGQELFKQNACWGCHKIEGYSKGNVGPELTYEGRIAVDTTIAHQLWDPRYKVQNCVMPYFFSQKIITDEQTGERYWVDVHGAKHAASELNGKQAIISYDETNQSLKDHDYIPLAEKQDDVDALVTFILSQTGLNYAQDAAGRYARVSDYNGADPPTVPVTAAEGQLIFSQSGCYACHYLGDPNNVRNGRGGVAGPNLSWEGSRHSVQWVTAHYVNPQAFVPKSIMPVFPFSDSQRQALSLYDTSFLPKGGHLVSPDQDLPNAAMQTDKISVPQVRYMTR